jgi:hypothetical protein
MLWYVQQGAVGHQAGVGRLAGAHPVGKPVSHLAHWAGVHGSLLAAMIVTALAAGSLLCAAWRNRQRRQQAGLSAAPVVDASDLDNGALIAYLTKTQDEEEEETQ